MRKRNDLTAEMLLRQMVADHVRHPTPYGPQHEQGSLDRLRRMAERVYVIDGGGLTAAAIVQDMINETIQGLSPDELAKLG